MGAVLFEASDGDQHNARCVANICPGEIAEDVIGSHWHHRRTDSPIRTRLGLQGVGQCLGDMRWS